MRPYFSRRHLEYSLVRCIYSILCSTILRTKVFLGPDDILTMHSHSHRGLFWLKIRDFWQLFSLCTQTFATVSPTVQSESRAGESTLELVQKIFGGSRGSEKLSSNLTTLADQMSLGAHLGWDSVGAGKRKKL